MHHACFATRLATRSSSLLLRSPQPQLFPGTERLGAGALAPRAITTAVAANYTLVALVGGSGSSSSMQLLSLDMAPCTSTLAAQCDEPTNRFRWTLRAPGVPKTCWAQASRCGREGVT